LARSSVGLILEKRKEEAQLVGMLSVVGPGPARPSSRQENGIERDGVSYLTSYHHLLAIITSGKATQIMVPKVAASDMAIICALTKLETWCTHFMACSISNLNV
jgi:hypothetical protein